MKSLLKLSKIFIFFLFFTNLSYSTEPVDIWNNQTVEENALEKNENEQIKEDSEKITVNEKITISDVVSLEIVEGQTENLVGLFDPDQNNLSLSMWLTSDGQDIKDALARINRIKLSNFSKDLLHRVLFTNSFAPVNNFSAEDFLNFKINWLLKQKKIEDLEKLLIANPNEIGRYPEVLKFLINEYLSSTEIDLACKKIELMDRNINNNYLEKLFVYCLIHQSREEEAKLVYEIMKEDGFKDKFFENKILYLLGITDSSDQIVKDDNLFNFFISHITAQDFTYNLHKKQINTYGNIYLLLIY